MFGGVLRLVASSTSQWVGPQEKAGRDGVIEGAPQGAYGEGSPIRSRGRVSDRQWFEPRRLTLPATTPFSKILSSAETTDAFGCTRDQQTGTRARERSARETRSVPQ